MSDFSVEIKALIKLAVPVSLSQLSIVGMTATDVLVAGQAGTVELAGMNLGNNVWNMIALFFMGVGFATQPLIAKQFGAQNSAGIKQQLHQSLWLCFVLGLLATAAVFVGSKFLILAEFEYGMRQIAHDYVLVMMLAAMPSTLVPALRGALEGMNLTRVVFLVNMVAFLINIPIDFILVHGLYGFPKLGSVGCAWASVFLLWSVFLALLMIIKVHNSVRSNKLLQEFNKPNKKMILSTLKLGLPIGLSIIIELSMFSGAGILIAKFGSVQASAHAVALTVASLSYMLYMGLGQGITIRASQFLGANKAELAWQSIKFGTVFILIVATIICVIFVLFDRQIISVFSNDAELIGLAMVLFLYAAIFQLADALHIAAMYALRAYQDTLSPPKYQFIAFWMFGLPLGIGLAFYNWWPGLEGAEGLWFAMVASLFLVGFLLFNKLLRVRRLELQSILR